MSASERLKAMEAQGVRFMVEPKSAGEPWRDALPQIVAVVEAAEMVPLDAWEELANEDILDLIDADVMHTFLGATRAALAALDKALT